MYSKLISLSIITFTSLYSNEFNQENFCSLIDHNLGGYHSTSTDGSVIDYDGSTVVIWGKSNVVSNDSNNRWLIKFYNRNDDKAFTLSHEYEIVSDSEYSEIREIDISGDGDTLVVGIYNDFHDLDPSVYGMDFSRILIFEKNENTWNEPYDLRIPETYSIGESVDITYDGSHIATSSDEEGKVAVFSRNGNSWEPKGDIINYPLPEVPNAKSLVFGDCVTIGNYGNVIAVSEENGSLISSHREQGIGHGIVYFYRYNNVTNTWVEANRFSPFEGSEEEIYLENEENEFGEQIDLSSSGHKLIITDSKSSDDSKRAYVYHYDGSFWQSEGNLNIPEGFVINNSSGNFGQYCSISDDGKRALVGAKRGTSLNGARGIVCLYEESGGLWNMVGHIDPANLALISNSQSLETSRNYGKCKISGNGQYIVFDDMGKGETYVFFSECTYSDPQDTDNDGLRDTWEYEHFGDLYQTGIDLYQTGVTDFDKDGYSNEEEETAQSIPTDSGSTPLDRDGDGYTNEEEETGGSDPANASSTPLDTDGDELLDTWENEYFGNLDQTGDGDYDSDGYTNKEEETAGSDPANTSSTLVDIDGDGYTNKEEETAGSDPANTNSTPVDTDGDGLLDSWENENFGNLDKAGDTDSDGDGFTNEEEETAGSDPSDISITPLDLDGDGLGDAFETQYFGNLDQDGTGDNDSDGYINSYEFASETDPTDSYSNPVYKAFTFWLNEDGTAYEVSDCDTSTSGEVVIPSSFRDDIPVTSIGYEAFNDCALITSVTIPDSVTAIGASAFNDCYSLTNIIIPDGVTSIRNGTFSSCSSLVSITIPNSVTSIEWYAFEFCTSLESIVIPYGVADIELATFYRCDSLKNVSIPDSVTTIEYLSFYGCSSLESITLPDSVTSIEGAVFAACSSLSEINIPSGVTAIRDETFKDCRALANISLPSSITTIGKMAFENCTSLTELIIPEGVNSIRERTFKGCTSLTNISIPQSVKTIEIYAFSNCATLENIDLPDQITTIDWGLFENCYSLQSIVIPEGVTNIEWFAFDRCTAITEITIPNTVTTIGGYAFLDCSSLTHLNIPSSVLSIGNGTFSDCTSLRSISFLGDAPSVGSDVFYNIPEDAVIDYRLTSSGFTSPTWEGVATTVLLLAPVLDIESSYETNAGDGVAINATPIDGYPADYTYQWYVNGIPIPPAFGGTENSVLITGTSSLEIGNWAVAVSNDAGTTWAEFTYKHYGDELNPPGTGNADLYTLDQIMDLRVGSTMIEVIDGKANITMTLEETSNISDWSNAATSQKTIEVDAPAGTRFFRFKMTE